MPSPEGTYTLVRAAAAKFFRRRFLHDVVEGYFPIYANTERANLGEMSEAALTRFAEEYFAELAQIRTDLARR